jgi:hypothetical protein
MGSVIIVRAERLSDGQEKPSEDGENQVAIAITDDGFFDQVGPAGKLEAVLEAIQEGYSIATAQTPINVLFSNDEFRRLITQTLTVSFSTATQASMIAVWTGLEGGSNATVQYALLDPSTTTIRNVGGDFVDASAAFTTLETSLADVLKEIEPQAEENEAALDAAVDQKQNDLPPQSASSRWSRGR